MAASPAPVVELTSVSARYPGSAGDVPLRDLTLAVPAGETLAVVGPNGAGKSTLLRVMAGTLPADQGEARLLGASLRSMDRRTVAKAVAFVAQSEEVRFAFTVREVVLMGRAPHQGARMAASDDDHREVDGVLERFDLTGLAHRPVDELSGGEKKRVAIARAFAQTTALLLLDEPTASLDVPHQVRLFAEIDAARRKGVASVVVTHDLQLAAAHATRVALLRRGELVAAGSVDEVLTEPLLERAFGWPIRVGRFDGDGPRVFRAHLER